MSRYTRTTNPHDLFKDNVHEANGLRDKKAIERQQRLSEERASIDALNREIAEEERIRNAKKAALRNEQLQEYSNYFKQKYEDPNYNKRGKNKGEIAIKIGSENRQITRKTYDEVSNGLIINPMREKAPERQSRQQIEENNYGTQVKAMRQRGQSHGYNIISNAFYDDNSNHNLNTNNYAKGSYGNVERTQPQFNRQQEQNKPPIKNEPELSEDDYKRYYEYVNMLKKNEDSERAQIEQQQEIKNNLYPQSNQYKEMPQSSMRNEQEEITAQMRQLSVQDDARSEYLANKKKNNSSFNAILNQDSQSQQNFPQNQNFDNDTKSYYSKLEQQKQYRDYLDSQVTAKHQVDQMTKNALSSGPNPYKALREKNSKFKEIPSNPYSNKNYNFNNPGHDSYLSSNPITNPVNSYKFNAQRKVSSGRLRNLGNNIVNK